MTKQEREIMRDKKNALAFHTVQTALNNGFSMYDIEKLATSIVCLAKFQKFASGTVDTQNLPRVWDF